MGCKMRYKKTKKYYYFVFIHPFSDGNGRCARFWVTLMLLNYDKILNLYH